MPSTAIAGRGTGPVAPTPGWSAFGEVGADRGVQGIAVEGGQEPGESGVGRGVATSGQVAADAEQLHDKPIDAKAPPVDDVVDLNRLRELW
ncbi:hypothetical protein [Streptomyces sp. ALI-76-A]|uniref:hypothetical protein n=1 Tax=Streptomyces sp. ALI-76-A TaxID=3025736 RepID=UPI00256EB2FA|nr:hypothetical protein [Streptomyces sp. ALI-76-A]MDL5198632.1 hypothetical protein [Streptomyces sp. ALI-76-A]